MQAPAGWGERMWGWMRRQRALRGLFAAMAIWAMALSMATPAQAANADYEQRVVDLVNTVRAQNGLPPVTLSAQLTASARAYSDNMGTANFFGHVGPDGSDLISRNEAAGYTDWVDLAENLSAGQPDPESVVKAWMASPTHRANILSPRVNEIGVGYSFFPKSTYGHYWTQEFGARP